MPLGGPGQHGLGQKLGMKGNPGTKITKNLLRFKPSPEGGIESLAVGKVAGGPTHATALQRGHLK